MRILFTILFFWFYTANAQTTYYVSNAGNDALNGTSTATAWQTIAKVNTVTFVPGDQILLKSGDSWNEKLVPKSSGTYVNPIKYGSYGTGAKPIITGLQAISVASSGSNIWTAMVTPQSSLNNVFVGGVRRAKGRYPNNSMLSLTGLTLTELQGGLTGTPNYSGGEVVIKPSHHIIEVAKIVSQSGGALSLGPGLTYTASLGRGYFIQNIVSVLDTYGEWSYDGITLSVYSATSPTVQASLIDTLVSIQNRNYLTFDGITVDAANMFGFELDSSSNITIINCTIRNSGVNGISGSKDDYAVIQNDSITDTYNNAINLVYIPNNATRTSFKAAVTDNYVKGSGMVEGMGLNGEGKQTGMYVSGDSSLIAYNRLDSIGYIGIPFLGLGSAAKYNWITNYCMIKDDGGAIYPGSGYVSIVGNIISDGGGVANLTEMIDAPNYIPMGIYLDNFDFPYVIIDSNTVYNTKYAGIYSNSNHHAKIRGNTIHSIAGNGINLPNTSGNQYGLTITNNIISMTDTSRNLIILDGNRFSDTINNNVYLTKGTYRLDLFADANYTLSGWRTRTGFDLNSSTGPTDTTGAPGILYINPTKTDSTISLGATSYYDAKGFPKAGSMTLKPYTSIILFNAKDAVYAPPDYTPVPYKNLRNVKFRKIRIN